MSQRQELVIEPGNPHDFDDQSLNDIADDIRLRSDRYSVRVVRRPERGYGVDLNELLVLWHSAAQSAAETAAVAYAVKKAVDGLVKRFKADERVHPDRPRVRVLLVCNEKAEIDLEIKITQDGVVEEPRKERKVIYERGYPSASDDDAGSESERA